MRHANIRLREEKDVIPETRFKIVFHFWEVEVWAYTPLHKFVRIMVEIECEVKQGTRHRLVVHRYAELIQMPSPRAKYISISYVEQKKRTTYRTMRTAGFSTSLYFFPPVSKSISLLIASRKLI